MLNYDAEVERERLRRSQAERRAKKLAEIAALQNDHDAFANRVRPIVEDLSKAQQELRVLPRDRKNRRMWTSWNGVLTESAKKRKAHLESECRRLEERLRQLQQTTPDPNASIAFLRPDGSIYTSFSNRIHELQLQLAYYVSTADKQEERNLNELLIRAKRQAAEEALAEKRQRKRATEKALLAQAKSRSRDLADTVKKRLNRTENCPYCGGLLGNDPHADHIYPQSKGGLSVDANMVYVCAVCNGNKADMTLTAFIERFSLNRAMVEQRLRDLGKDF